MHEDFDLVACFQMFLLFLRKRLEKNIFQHFKRKDYKFIEELFCEDIVMKSLEEKWEWEAFIQYFIEHLCNFAARDKTLMYFSLQHASQNKTLISFHFHNWNISLSIFSHPQIKAFCFPMAVIWLVFIHSLMGQERSNGYFRGTFQSSKGGVLEARLEYLIEHLLIKPWHMESSSAGCWNILLIKPWRM